MADEKKLTTRGEDYSAWYNEVVQRAELADYAPVRGCMVVRPYGTALWESIQSGLDRRFKETGHENAMFPLLIPESFMRREREHVEGFAPELAVVTIGGGKQLEEPLVIRPTSETVIGHMYSKWIQSYRDLPVLMNQWCSVVRWELRTRLFLRTLEFYWQEGHTAHATFQEAQEETMRMLDTYEDAAVRDMSIPVVKGRKSRTEKFKGADNSYSIEAMMGDTKALQAGTSHMLGQRFARAFEIRYLDQSNDLQYCWTTSWGVSSRLIGAVIMVHGDDQGLKLPPVVAPVQAIIVPIWRQEEQKAAVLDAAEKVRVQLAGSFRVKVDKREEITPGFKFNDWELRGVPVRIEIGPKDIANESVVVARRDVPGRAGKQVVPVAGLSQMLADTLHAIQAGLLEAATAFRDAHIHTAADYGELRQVVEEGWARAFWCGQDDCETRIKEDTKATNRCTPLDQEGAGNGRCVVCGQPAQSWSYWARAY
ncbi:MAG TPA: proline--tRNA ligase [Anaerolineae bacterium]|nr:proline--tRNA ligase [Anaerolineae bacterium]